MRRGASPGPRGADDASCQNHAVDTAAYLAHLRHDGPALLVAANGAIGVGVPSCPQWTMAELVGHVGGVHRWVEQMVRDRSVVAGRFPAAPEGWDERAGWYEEGLALLVGALEGIGPDEPVWNWAEQGPGPARFWHRRMAHETAVHRWDAQNAAGAPLAIDTNLAVDGIDEYLAVVSTRLQRAPKVELAGALGLDVTDSPVSYTLVLEPDHVERRHGLDGADAVVRATASDLLLWILGRHSTEDDALVVAGDQAVAAAWAGVTF